MVHKIEVEGMGNNEYEAIGYAKTVLEDGLGPGWKMNLLSYEYVGTIEGIPVWNVVFVCEQPN